MTRLTELEVALEAQAPRATQDRTPELQAAILEARRLQNQALAQMIHAAYRGIAAFAGAITQIIVKPIAAMNRRRRTIQELNRLDARLLRDIGLERADIEVVAAALAEESGPRLAWKSAARRLVAGLAADLAGRIETARMRRRTIRSLEALSDKVLEDIGIRRSEIEATVNRLVGEQAVRDDGQTQAAKAKDHGLRAQAAEALRPLRQWHISRLAAVQMARFDPEALADLGYVKGDIDWVPEVMAKRKLQQPANCNPGAAKVA
jgi:uncharacterized protein YjiS (DUF1127 family)